MPKNQEKPRNRYCTGIGGRGAGPNPGSGCS
jgi:hypothetical protein